MIAVANVLLNGSNSCVAGHELATSTVCTSIRVLIGGSHTRNSALVAVPFVEVEVEADTSSEVAALAVPTAFGNGTALDRVPRGVSNSTVLPCCSAAEPTQCSDVLVPCVTHRW